LFYKHHKAEDKLESEFIEPGTGHSAIIQDHSNSKDETENRFEEIINNDKTDKGKEISI
jgi:hypothetical protein